MALCVVTSDALTMLEAGGNLLPGLAHHSLQGLLDAAVGRVEVKLVTLLVVISEAFLRWQAGMTLKC